MPRWIAWGALGAAVAAVTTQATAAWAADDDVATAQVLFEEGRRRMAQKDYAGACPKLAESQRLSPAVGTEFNLADCWEHVGKIASAWSSFLEVVDQTHRRGEAEREQAARRRADALEPRLGRLIVDVPMLRRVAELEVRRDGEVVRDALYGVAVPVDAGEHRIEVHAAGRRPWSAIVRTSDGQTASITIPDLEVAPPSASAAVPPATAGPVPPPPVVTAPSSADHTAAAIVLGGSVVFAGVGILGVLEHQSNVSQYNADSTCPAISAASLPPHCAAFVNAANTWNVVGVVGFVASGLALGAGITLWLTAPRSRPGTTATIHCSGGLASIGCVGLF